MFSLAKVVSEQKFGAQSFTEHEDALVVVRYHDPLRPSEMGAIVERLDEIYKIHGQLYGIADMSKLSEFPARVRSDYRFRNMQFSALAITGTSFALRTAVMMIIRAGRALKYNSFSFPIEFFATKTEALDWLWKMKVQASK